MSEILLPLALAANIFLSLLLFFSLRKVQSELHSLQRPDSESRLQQLQQQAEQTRAELLDELRHNRLEQQQLIQNSWRGLGENLAAQQQRVAEMQDRRLAELIQQLNARQEALQNAVAQALWQMEERLQAMNLQNSANLEQMRQTMERRLGAIQEENSTKLEQMRATVDEKLQKTLEERIGQSFRLVSERLEQVYKGLGEMQSLASGVGDLKRVLTNVKTRGILGEIQLGAILEQILNREQYYTNIATRPGSTQVVEYAVRLPGDDSAEVLLPIDAKFPGDTYSRLMEAYESGNAAEIAAAGSQLERAIKGFARDIRDKYLEPPYTTDFAIMFLPFEGLYAEVLRLGLMENLQREYRVSIAGPTTMAALLNSLQMGFRTLAVQKRSGEVWRVLGAVKTEFAKFGDVLQAAQKRLEQTNKELETLVGVRTRQIQRSLSSVSELSAAESRSLVGEQEPS